MSDLPKQSAWLFHGFRKYAVRYVRKHFHAVRLSLGSAPLPADDAPVLVAMNHPAWWDPMIAFVLSREFPQATHFGAIDARALQKYRFFAKVGLFGVEMDTYRGAADFLRTGTAILQQDRTVLWITAQGEFADVRRRPLNLRSGVGHLAARMNRGWVLPIAIEYVFWNESKPEVLVRFGEPLPAGGGDGRDWTARIESSLTDSLDRLNTEAISRDAGLFRPLVSGRTGIGGVYDCWRRCKAWFRGERFDPSHEGRP